jgi:hypothetical protein
MLITSPVGTVEIVNSLGLDVDRPVLPPLLGILIGGFHEDIGLALDGEAGVAYVTDLAGRIHVVPISESAKGSNGARVLADLHEPLTGLAGLKASEL